MPGNIDIEKEGAGGPETGLCGNKLAEEVMEKEAAKSRPKLGYFLKPKKGPEPEPESFSPHSGLIAYICASIRASPPRGRRSLAVLYRTARLKSPRRPSRN